MSQREGARQHHQAGVRCPCQFVEDMLNFGRSNKRTGSYQLHVVRRDRRTDRGHDPRAAAKVGANDRHFRDLWCDLLEQTQPFAADSGECGQ
jgi:hypothetical protein